MFMQLATTIVINPNPDPDPDPNPTLTLTLISDVHAAGHHHRRPKKWGRRGRWGGCRGKWDGYGRAGKPCQHCPRRWGQKERTAVLLIRSDPLIQSVER